MHITGDSHEEVLPQAFADMTVRQTGYLRLVDPAGEDFQASARAAETSIAGTDHLKVGSPFTRKLNSISGGPACHVKYAIVAGVAIGT